MGEGQLDWPPRKEDLQRLYVDEHLSAAKIARLYGLKYADPKTAESTVLYHLKRTGIARRDPTEHVRKVTEEMVDGWVRRYQAGESLKQIAGDRVTAVSVFNHLRRRGIKLRNKVEAQIKVVTKHPRNPFAGDALNRAYLLGFVLGDCAVVRHGRAIRVRTSTTHPAMAELFDDLFGRYGFVKKYPRAAKLTGFEWSLEVDLDDSFEFLLDAKKSLPPEPPEEDAEFLSYLAGFFDAEGSVYFHKKSLHGGFELSISNVNGPLLQKIAEKLADRALTPKVRQSSQASDRGIGSGSDSIWRLSLWRWGEVQKLLLCLGARHPEKIAKIAIALKLGHRPSREETSKVISQWMALKDRIGEERKEFLDKAELALNRKKGL